MQAPQEQPAAAAAAEATTKKKILIIMRGAPGSGKSSAAIAIASQDAENVGICSADYFFYNPKGLYQFNRRNLQLAHDFCYKTFLALVKQEVRTIILDNTNIKLEDYQRYVTAAQKNGYEVMQCIPGNNFNNIHAVPELKVSQMTKNFEEDNQLPQFTAPETAHHEDLHMETFMFSQKARRLLKSQAATSAGTSPNAFLAAKSTPRDPESAINFEKAIDKAPSSRLN